MIRFLARNKSFVSGFSVLVMFVAISLLPLQKAKAQQNPSIKGRIQAILEESKIAENSYYQKLEVKLTNGEVVTVENDPQTSAKNIRYQRGNRVILTEIPDRDGTQTYIITDFNRTPYLITLFVVFSLLAVLIARKKGIYSLIGMAISFLVIFKLILPQISAGRSPLLITIAASVFLIPTTFYLSHGFNKKTHVAVVSTLITLTITAIFTSISISAAKLTGFASEEARFLQIANQDVNVRGLLLAGIIIGFLGILDDVTISQANVVLKLKEADPMLGTLELYKKAMEVGRDHIASMVNTLVLVYAGASLPLLLLFVDNPEPFAMVLNREIIADEVVRTLLGSMGLILAVPFTTVLTSLVAESE